MEWDCAAALDFTVTFTVLVMVPSAAMGRDIRLSEDRIEGYRHFVNKLGNASRFALMNLPEGCVFSPRCPYATDKCRKQRPERFVTESGHYSACHYSGDPEFLKNAPETSRTRKDSKKGGEA